MAFPYRWLQSNFFTICLLPPVCGYIVHELSVFCFTDCLRQAMKIETVIDEVFGGQNVNTVICRECLTVSDVTVITHCATNKGIYALPQPHY